MSKQNISALMTALLAMVGTDSGGRGGRVGGRLPGGRSPNPRRHGMRKATVRPWNSKENERRRRQVRTAFERGILKGNNILAVPVEGEI